jgi:hypothetical protein
VSGGERPRRPADETWKALEDAAWASELARIDALNEHDLDRELVHAGVDPGIARRICQEAIERAAHGAGVDPREWILEPARAPTGEWDTPEHPRRGLILLVAAALGIVVIVALLLTGARRLRSGQAGGDAGAPAATVR